MAKGILAKKLGMTQIFTDEGRLLPVTVLDAAPCRVLQVKTAENDGYNALQVGFGPKRKKHVTKPMQGHFDKSGAQPVRFIRELRLPGPAEYQAGQEISVDIFAAGDLIDVTGVSKGKGFAGGIKRHNFHRGLMSHGSKSHREPGSIGPRMSGPGGKVFKGKKLPGRMGGAKVTVQRLTVVRIDKERGLMLIKGAVPGPKGGFIVVRNTVKPGK
ncbi:MAG: 50S ribosomal protein L3 [Acidaminococcales bacterium]|jgi:large subunit ribosomal protein L3|nr:50S ribosomal protein L3 [Acidaminococcales bacterium]